MYGIFVNEIGGIRYARLIVKGYKPIETRNKNMLKKLIGKRVAIIRTCRGKNPVIVGYVTIDKTWFCPACDFDKYRDKTMIPAGSAYDCNTRGKWFYELSSPEECPAYELPQNAVRHGRSYCEF